MDQAVLADDESREYVERLERQVDTDEELLPTGDDLAAELELFLREQQAADGENLEDGENPGDAGVAESSDDDTPESGDDAADPAPEPDPDADSGEPTS